MTFENILTEFYGVKKVFLKKPRIAARYKVTGGSKYFVYEALTICGGKAFAKLVGLMYDLEFILGGNFKAATWATKLKNISGVGDGIEISAEPRNICLNSIVSNHFGCKKVFLKNRRVCGHLFDEPVYEYHTVAGGKAYEKLINLIETLEVLFGNGFDANIIVNELDEICTQDY